MPTLGQLECNVVWRGSDVGLEEYETQYHDGVVATFIPVPPHPTRFQVRLRSYGTILWGLAMFIFIDGEYQCNRNSGQRITDIELRCSHRETDMVDGRFFRAPWKFERVNQVKEGESAIFEAPFDGECVGTIEVVVLRLASSDRAIPLGLPPSNPTAQLNRRPWAGGDGVQEDQTTPSLQFGLDGSHDEPGKHSSVRRRRSKNKHHSGKVPDPLPAQNNYNFFFGGLAVAPAGAMKPYMPGAYDYYRPHGRAQETSSTSSSTSSSSDSSGKPILAPNHTGPPLAPHLQGCQENKGDHAGGEQAQVSAEWTADAQQPAPEWNQAPIEDENNGQDNSGAQWNNNEGQEDPPNDTGQFFTDSQPNEPNNTAEGNYGGGWEADNQADTGGWNGANNDAKDNEDDNNTAGWGRNTAHGGTNEGWGAGATQGTSGWGNQPGDTANPGGWGASGGQPHGQNQQTTTDENETPQWTQNNGNTQTDNQAGGLGDQEGQTADGPNNQAADESNQAQNDNAAPEQKGEASETPQQNVPAAEAANKPERPRVPPKFAYGYDRRPQPYWDAWREAAFRGEPAPFAVFDPHSKAPIYSLREDVIQRNNTTHQVAVGRARRSDPHPEMQSTPKYLDDPDHPFAVFVFKFRDEETLSNMLDRDVRETPAQEAKRVVGLSKEKIAEYYMRKEGHEPPSKFKAPTPSARSGYVANAPPPHFTESDLYALNSSFNRNYPAWPPPDQYRPRFIPGAGPGYVRHRGSPPPERYPHGPTYPPLRPGGEYDGGDGSSSVPLPIASGNFSNPSNTTNDNLNIALRNMKYNKQQTHPVPPPPGLPDPVSEGENNRPPPLAPYGHDHAARGFDGGWRSGTGHGHPWRTEGRDYEVYDPGHPRGRRNHRDFTPQRPR